MAVAIGSPIHGEFASADASALTEPNSRILLYGGGRTTAITLAATDQVIVTSIVVNLGATARTVTIYDGADNVADAGEVLSLTFPPVNGTVVIPLIEPHFCQVGTWPKVITSGAGQVNVIIHGTIYRKGS